MEPNKQRNNYWLFVGSVAFIFVALGFFSVLNLTRSSDSSTDVRAKAGALSTLKLNGTVSSTDSSNGTFVINNAMFADTAAAGGKNLGTWTVTAPPGYKVSSLTPGRKVTITIDSTTMMVTSHTVTATDIR